MMLFLRKWIMFIVNLYVKAFKTRTSRLYKIIELYKNNDEQQMVVVKIIDDPHGVFTMPVHKLVSTRKDLLSGFSINDIVNIIGLATNEKMPQIMEIRQSPYKFYSLLAMLFGAILVISNILSSKLILVAGYSMTGGQIVFPFSYMLGDIITEVYGYKRSRLLIWGSIFCNIVFIFFAEIAIHVSPSPYYHLNNEFALIIGSVPRVIVASLIGYFCGEFINSFVLSNLKILDKGRHIWRRLSGSSVIAVAVASCVFTCTAFIGTIPVAEVLFLMLRVYAACLIYIIMLLPLTMYLIGKLKKMEKIDIYDFNINYSPFSLDVSYNEQHNQYQCSK